MFFIATAFCLPVRRPLPPRPARRGRPWHSESARHRLWPGDAQYRRWRDRHGHLRQWLSYHQGRDDMRPRGTLFEACAGAGYTGAMTWMSQLDNNGLGGEYNPMRRPIGTSAPPIWAIPVGKFNHGPGPDARAWRGARRGRRAYVDAAAKDGLTDRQRLQGAGYDLDEVTPGRRQLEIRAAFLAPPPLPTTKG